MPEAGCTHFESLGLLSGNCSDLLVKTILALPHAITSLN